MSITFKDVLDFLQGKFYEKFGTSQDSDLLFNNTLVVIKFSHQFLSLTTRGQNQHLSRSLLLCLLANP
jgi:hypothetical protein